MSEPRDILRRHCSGESVTSPIPKLTLLRSDVVNEPSAVSYAPLFCMLASGRKRVWLGRQEFVYGPRDYLITSAELPLVAQVIEAPYLGFAFALDPEVIAEILLKLPKADPGRVPSKAVAVARPRTSCSTRGAPAAAAGPAAAYSDHGADDRAGDPVSPAARAARRHHPTARGAGESAVAGATGHRLDTRALQRNDAGRARGKSGGDERADVFTGISGRSRI